MKSFLVIGLGRFGTALAQELCVQGHEVLAMDLREERTQAVADRVTVLHQGQVLAEGSLREVQANEQVIEVYLGR